MQTVPIKGKPTPVLFEGICKRKPWEYQVTVSIPVLNQYEQLEVCVALLRAQTVKPFIIIVDTGSDPEQFEKIKALADEDLEVHTIRANGMLHSSEIVTWAVDLCFSMARTEYVFTTHSDCLLKRKDTLESFLRQMQDGTPVVGYQISPRFHTDWTEYFGHTATMFHVGVMDDIGLTWAMHRLKRLYNLNHWKNVPNRPTFPDTETVMNTILRANNVKRKFIGTEENFTRNNDEFIDHVRSLTCSSLYNTEYRQKAEKWWQEAKKDALARLEKWSKEPNYDEPKFPFPNNTYYGFRVPPMPNFTENLPKLFDVVS